MTGNKGKETPAEKVARNRSMIDVAILQGVSWKELTRRLGIGYEELRKAVDPNYKSMKDKILADKDKLLAMRESGMTWDAIAEKTGYKVKSLENTLDRQAIDLRRKKDRERQKYTPMFKAEPKVVVRGELPPPDTRNLTQRIFGDPLPGRSHLDRMRSQQQEHRA